MTADELRAGWDRATDAMFADDDEVKYPGYLAGASIESGENPMRVRIRCPDLPSAEAVHARLTGCATPDDIEAALEVIGAQFTVVRYPYFPA